MTYPGGKGTAYQKLINLMPPHACYIETHYGGGAVMRHKRPAADNIAIDINPDVIAATIAAHGDAAPSALDDTTTVGDTVGDTAVDSDAAAPSQPAMQDSTATNGGGRPQWRAAHTVIDGDATRYHYITADCIDVLSAYQFRGDELVYADPPYVMSSRRQQRALYAYEYTDTDHVALLTCLKRLPCKVMISGYWSELYAGILAGWHTATFSCQTRGGTPATEWVWMNYPPPLELHDYAHLGDDYRERERIKRKKTRWVNKLRGMDELERRAILWAIRESGVME